MKNKKLVIFDFDGVIVNTHGVSFPLNQASNPHLTEELYYQMSEGNFFASFESDTPIITFTPHPNFREEYRKGILLLDMPPFLKESVISMSKSHNLAICSSAFDKTIEKFLEKEGLLDIFSDVWGVEVNKSKVVKFQNFLEKYELDNKDVVFITDTLGDILEAHEVGIKTIAVTWGLHNRETLEKGKPEIVVDLPEQLEKTIDNILF